MLGAVGAGSNAGPHFCLGSHGPTPPCRLPQLGRRPPDRYCWLSQDASHHPFDGLLRYIPYEGHANIPKLRDDHFPDGDDRVWGVIERVTRRRRRAPAHLRYELSTT